MRAFLHLLFSLALLSISRAFLDGGYHEWIISNGPLENDIFCSMLALENSCMNHKFFDAYRDDIKRILIYQRGFKRCFLLRQLINSMLKDGLDLNIADQPPFMEYIRLERLKEKLHDLSFEVIFGPRSMDLKDHFERMGLGPNQRLDSLLATDLNRIETSLKNIKGRPRAEYLLKHFSEILQNGISDGKISESAEDLIKFLAKAIKKESSPSEMQYLAQQALGNIPDHFTFKWLKDTVFHVQLLLEKLMARADLKRLCREILPGEIYSCMQHSKAGQIFLICSMNRSKGRTWKNCMPLTILKNQFFMMSL